MHMTIRHEIIFLRPYHLPPFLHYSIFIIIFFSIFCYPAFFSSLFSTDSIFIKIILFSIYCFPTCNPHSVLIHIIIGPSKGQPPRMHMTIRHHIIIGSSKGQPPRMSATIWHEIISLAIYCLPPRLTKPFFI